MKVHEKVEPWNVTLIDTGENTMTGGRLKRIANYLDDDQSFCFTYGDSLSDVNISELLDFQTPWKIGYSNSNKSSRTLWVFINRGHFCEGISETSWRRSFN